MFNYKLTAFLRTETAPVVFRLEMGTEDSLETIF